MRRNFLNGLILHVIIGGLLVGGFSGCGRSVHNNKAKVLLDRCVATLMQGRHDDARALCEVAEEYAPTYAEVQNALGLIDLAEGHDDDALLRFKRAVAFGTDFLEPLVNIGSIHQRRGDLIPACDAFAEAVTIDPGYTPARRNLAICRRQSGELDLARQEFRRCLAVAPTACDCLLGLGAMHLDRGRFDDAGALFGRAIASCAEPAQGHYNRCIARYRAGRCEEALSDCQAALLLDPGLLEAAHNRDVARRCVEIDGGQDLP